MDCCSFEELYEIRETAAYILRHRFTCVALQFPDSLLKVSSDVASALRLQLKQQSSANDSVNLYVLADTTYGSCCGDEIAAAHVNAECIIHYGHACLSRSSRLPIRYVFGRSVIDVDDCISHLVQFGSKCKQTILVLFDLQLGYAMLNLKKKLLQNHSETNVIIADVLDREICPSANLRVEISEISRDDLRLKPFTCKIENCNGTDGHNNSGCSCAGLKWVLPKDCKMEDVIIFWIGQEGAALTQIMLTFSSSRVILYNHDKKCLICDVPTQSKFLMRRYYLVERAKDANIVGIVVGTLGVAGHQEMVRLIKNLVKESGKKSYTLVIGKPNSAKLANFPECDIFVLVACPQTALLDSKDYMVPVITPYEAVIAWRRASQWTGAYSLDFRSVMDLHNSYTSGMEKPQEQEEARFSFIKGSYVEEEFKKRVANENHQEELKSMSLATQSEETLQLQERKHMNVLSRVEARTGAEYFLSRSFQGLELGDSEKVAKLHVVGRKGRAAAYDNELQEQTL